MTTHSFVLRWARRSIRREWRHHLGALVIVTLGVAAAVAGTIAAVNLVEPAHRDVGRADFIATSSDPAALTGALEEQGLRFGVRSSVRVRAEGSAAELEVRTLDPTNPLVEPLVDLVAGRWPETSGEIAATDRAPIDGSIGASVTMAGRSFTVVGRIENPSDLGDEFVLLPANAPLGDLGEEPLVEVLVAADEDAVDFSGVGDVGIADFGPPPAVVAAVVVNVAAAVGLVEVALVVSASFAVAASRRARQYGLLAAAGAAPRTVRRAARSIGAGIGLLGALAGVSLGIATAWILVPGFESSVGHRISFAVPWWTVAPSAFVAVAATTVAADAPAKALMRRSVSQLLGSERPRPEPLGRRVALGVTLAAFGVVALWVGFGSESGLLAVAGAVAAPIGLILVAPLAATSMGRGSRRLPLPLRVAGRSLARSPKRTAAVVAGIGLALAAPMGIAAVTSSLDARDAGRGTNLAENWLIAWVPARGEGVQPVPSDSAVDAASARVEGLARDFPELDLVPIEAAVGRAPGGEGGESSPVVAARKGVASCSLCDTDAYGFGERDPNGDEIEYQVGPAWVASPELVAALQLDPDWHGALAVAESDGLGLVDSTGVVVADQAVHVAAGWPHHSSLPQVLYAPEAVGDSGHHVVRIGWLAVGDGPIDPATQDRLAAAAGSLLRLEFHEPLAPASGLRRAGLLGGVVLGAGMAFSALTLLLAEMGGDLRLLDAIGASPGTLRRIAAGAGGFVALAGAVLAVLIGALALVPLRAGGGGEFPTVVPWGTLAVVLGGFPLLMAAVGAATGGRRLGLQRRSSWENGSDARPAG